MNPKWREEVEGVWCMNMRVIDSMSERVIVKGFGIMTSILLKLCEMLGISEVPI